MPATSTRHEHTFLQAAGGVWLGLFAYQAAFPTFVQAATVGSLPEVALDLGWVLFWAILAAVVVTVFAALSKARFFFAAMSVVGAETGHVAHGVGVFDYVKAGTIELGRPEPAAVSSCVHVALISLAALLFWLDHKRRPSAVDTVTGQSKK